jgi:hypothetical protein
MKTLKGLGMLMLGLFIISSCSDDENNRTNKLSSEEQAEIVASAMGQSGFVGASEQSAEQADDATDGAKVVECGFTDDGSANLSGAIGSISFSYMFEYDIALDCDNNEEPESFQSEFTYEGSFESPRFESDYSGSGSLIITQLGDETNYEIDGSYSRAGSFQTHVGDQRSGSSEIDIDINSVFMRKSDKKVVDGSADVSVKGQVTGRGSYSFDAHVEFHDNGTATITVDGDQYLMIVATGEVTEE